MNISNLDHLETISEAPRVVGALSLHWEEKLKEISSKYKVYSTSESWDRDGIKADVFTAFGHSSTDGSNFAYVSSSVTSSKLS